jgi:hypothetical protein
MSSGGGVVWQVAHHRLHWLFGFGEELVIGQVIGVEVGFDGLEIRHASCGDSGFFSGYRNSKFSLTTIFSSFCN